MVGTFQPPGLLQFTEYTLLILPTKINAVI
jgi:hypothetical protein